jgi:flagellar biosynthesis/type III secretory pathway protein FliH
MACKSMMINKMEKQRENEILEEERVADQEWKKLESKAWKEGYREGLDMGTEQALQQGTESCCLSYLRIF